jgi:hypothetical protein
MRVRKTLPSSEPTQRPSRINSIRASTARPVTCGAPFGPDDGTVAPWVVLASLPFAPEIVLPTVRSLAAVGLGGKHRPYGFRCSFNRTFLVDDSPTGWWVTPYKFGIDQGPWC